MAVFTATRRSRNRNGSPPQRSKGGLRLNFAIDGESNPGLELVKRLLETGEKHDEELSRAVAEQAIDGLASLELGFLVSDIIESGEAFAEQVHSQATRGLQEVVQNADDQAARNIRFAYRKRGGKPKLLIAHDGDEVELYDVIRMAIPTLSGSRDDPDKIGRFGIGLKTLNQLGDRLEVHCPPLPGFEIRGGRVTRIKTPSGVRDFWDPTARQTMFVLHLNDERFDAAFFKNWLSEWDASSLLFLRHLQRVSLVDLNARRPPIERAVTVSKPQAVELDLPKATGAQQCTVSDEGSARKWTRYVVRYPRLKTLRSTHKEMGDTVRLQLAVSTRPGEGRLYAGLPLEESCTLPYSVSAPFEPNVERTRLRDHNNLNDWLVGRLGDLATAVSLRRFADRPKTAWLTVPLAHETAGDTDWTTQQFERMVERQRERVAQKVRLALPDGGQVKLDDLVFESEHFDGLLSAADVERLWGQASTEYARRRAVPTVWRDGRRWRNVLEDLNKSPLTDSDALGVLDWPDDEIAGRKKGWLVGVLAAGLAAGREDELWERRCVELAGTAGRRSPAQLAADGTLLVHSLPKEGLAAGLDLAQQIARPFRARNNRAQQVRAWLTSRGVLREKASDAEALRTLSRAKRGEAIDLRRRPKVLQRVRNSLRQLPQEERAEIAAGVGRNIALAGYHFEDGKKRSCPVRPAEAYLPSAIDKNEGWPFATGTTAGLRWVDPSYRSVLKGPRGEGALVTLRELGAATAPRLARGTTPSGDPNARRLIDGKLNAQHKAELSDLPSARGLMDDWLSPDLEAVVGDLVGERSTTTRRRRSHALFLCLARAWEEQYADRSTATAVHHYHTWRHDGEVSATWVARLASASWLSTRAPRFHPAAPRDLTVLTPASFEIEGEQLEKYVYEIDEEHVESPVVEALAIQGRPFASAIVERLKDMRWAEKKGAGMPQGLVDRCYEALASYCPGGGYAERSDLTARQFQRVFADGPGDEGLIRADGHWLTPSKVRREPAIDGSIPTVRGAEGLWTLLGIEEASAADCARALKNLSKRRESSRSSEVNIFRRLLELSEAGRLRRKDLEGLPLRTYRGWQNKFERPVYAVAAPGLAESLGAKWPVWRPPLPLEALTPLLDRLGVELIDPSALEADVPSYLAACSDDLRAGFISAVAHLRDYLAIHQPLLHDRLGSARWWELSQAEVIAGNGWSIKVRHKGKRAVSVTVRAHLFEDPPRLCLLHEDEAGDPETGGEAIAGFLLGRDAKAEDHSTLSLAWAHAFNKRNLAPEGVVAQAEEDEDPRDAPSFDQFVGSARRSTKRGRRLKRRKERTVREPPRQLVDIDKLDLSTVVGTFLEGKRRGRLKALPKTKIVTPNRRRRDNGAPSSGSATGYRAYSDGDREDVAFAIVAAVLADDRGLDLVDISDDDNAGADAVDYKRDIWIELKTHSGEASDSLRLQPSQAKLADEKRGNYWLVVVWNLEAPTTPQFVVIPDPVRRLDTYLAKGLSLTGVKELAAESR